MNRNKIAVIFDMDGVIVQNDLYHCKAWEKFGQDHGIRVEFEEIKSWFGNINKTILLNLFGDKLSDLEIENMSSRKEEIYREIYEKEISPVPGLINFLAELQKNHIPAAVATSAPRENVDFVMENTGIRNYFELIIDSSHITNGKPFPEIYLKAASALNISPSNCLVFEDSFNGIESGKRAGMKVIGLATTHKKEELNGTIMNISDFNEIDVGMIKKLMN